MSSTKTHRHSALAVALLLFSTIILVISPNWAMADLIYDNGPPDTSYGPVVFSVDGSDAVSDSFTLSSTTTLTGGQIALWVNSFYSPNSSVDWSIGVSPFSSSSSGTAVLTCSPADVTLNGYTLYNASFSLSTPSPLAPGAYWLTLTNHLSLSSNTPSNDAFWAASADPPDGSEAMTSWYWSNGTPPPESFQLFGTAVPEAGTLTLLGSSALLSLGVVYLRRRGATA
jgi:hypothetical protein